MPTIRCKACGRLYDYRKQGMCPKCGAYNRPPRRERVDPDGTVHYVDREDPSGVVRAHPGEKVCYEEKTCYEDQVRPSLAQRVQAVREARRDGGYIVAAVVVVLLLAPVIGSCAARHPAQSYPEPVAPAQEIVSGLTDLGNDAELVEYRASWEYDLLTEYTGDGFCYPGYLFSLLGQDGYVSALTLDSGVLTAAIPGYPEIAAPPELVLTLDTGEDDTIETTYMPCTSFEDNTYSYDLLMLSQDLRSQIIFLDLQIPLSAYDGKAADILVDISDVLPVNNQ